MNKDVLPPAKNKSDVKRYTYFVPDVASPLKHKPPEVGRLVKKLFEYSGMNHQWERLCSCANPAVLPRELNLGGLHLKNYTLVIFWPRWFVDDGNW